MTTNASPRVSTPTVFQNRFKVASAPAQTQRQWIIREWSEPEPRARFVAVTAGPDDATVACVRGATRVHTSGCGVGQKNVRDAPRNAYRMLACMVDVLGNASAEGAY